jgi:hypothetical protein
VHAVHAGKGGVHINQQRFALPSVIEHREGKWIALRRAPIQPAITKMRPDAVGAISVHLANPKARVGQMVHHRILCRTNGLQLVCRTLGHELWGIGLGWPNTVFKHGARKHFWSITYPRRYGFMNYWREILRLTDLPPLD